MKQYFLIFILLATIVFPLSTVHAQDAEASLERLRITGDAEQIPVLDELTKSIVVARCQAAQSAVRSSQKPIDMAVRARLLTYSTIQKELKALEIRMTKQGADASEIDLLIGKIQQELDKFSQKSRTYQQLSEDLIVIDCAANPDIFANGLNNLRQTQKELKATAADLYAIIINSPESTFNPLIDRLTI